MFITTTTINIPINLTCGLFHWVFTGLINRLSNHGQYSHKLRIYDQKRHCYTGVHARTQYSYTPLRPYQGCDESPSLPTPPNTEPSIPTPSPSTPTKPPDHQPTSHDPPGSNLKIPPDKIFTVSICGHFVMDCDALSKVDPLTEITSSLKSRSAMPQSTAEATGQSNSRAQSRSATTGTMKSRSAKSQRANTAQPRSANTAKPRNVTKKSRSDNTQKSKSGNTNTNNAIKPSTQTKTPRVKFKDMNMNINLKSHAGHNSNRLYLDSGASVNIIFNRGLLGKLKTLLKPIQIAAAGKPMELQQVSSLHKALQHLPLPTEELYYEPTAIANLLSFAKIADEYYVICNTRIDDAIYVQSKSDGRYLRFQRCTKNNLYYVDIGEGDIDGYCNFNTVAKGKLMFSQLDQNRAKAVRILQEQCGFPSDHDFIHALECNMIPGVDFGRRDVKIANEIYGYNDGAAMGKMKHPRKGQKMDRTSEDVTSPVPPQILKHYRKVHLDMDILFINGVAFFLCTSRDIGFIHCKPVLTRHNKRVQDALTNIVADYRARGFKVVTASGDNAFAPLKDWMKKELKTILTTCDSDSHVPRAENAIKFVKERVRCVQSQLPFKKLPRRLTIEMVRRIVVLINSFHRKTGIHPVVSPRQLMYGRKFKTPLCKIGELVLAYDTLASNDTGHPRAFFALYIEPNDNGTGHRVIKLQTKRLVTTPKCIPKPMTQDVINIVNNLGKEEGSPDGIQFMNIDGRATLEDLYPDEEHEDDSCVSDIDYKTESDDEEEELSVDDSIGDEIQLLEEEFNDEQNASEEDDEEENHNYNDDENDLENLVQNNEIPFEEHQQANNDNENIFDNNNPHMIPDDGGTTTNESDNNEISSETISSCSTRRSNRVDTSQDLSYESNTDEPDEEQMPSILEQSIDDDNQNEDNNSDEDPDLRRPKGRHKKARYKLASGLDGSYWKKKMIGAMVSNDSTGKVDSDIMEEYFQLEASKSTPQYGFKKGLRLFEQEGKEATVKELKDNLIGRGCLEMLDPHEVTNEIRKIALSYLMFLKRKRNGIIKGRGCADGRPQRDYITKNESRSPTVSLYALMASCVLDAIEHRNVITVDIPGAFLQGDWPQHEHPAYIRFEGEMVDMICEIDSSYKSKIIYSNNGKRKLLYGRLVKAVYGTLLAAIIFYQKLAKHLTNHGFKQNQYDECTFNKMVENEQLTVQFHVDDLKASHKDNKVLEQFLKDLRSEFGNETELSETRGLIHDYLGMTIDYSIPGKVAFTMFDFLEDVIVEAPENLKCSKSQYPGNNNLFKVSKTSPLLSIDDAELFHRLVARLLFASKRGRPDIQVCVAFLCTRVKAPTEEDYKKLVYVISYLKNTIHLPLVVGADDSGTMIWNIDASYAVHPDCRSHTGASLTLGHGSLLSLSTKQKINTKSSTEAELVGVDDAMTFIMWMKHFIQDQVKDLKINSKLGGLGNNVVIEQDNTSAIQLENNGWGSSSRRTKHINVRYFFVTDRLKQGDVSKIVYKPTELMQSDYLTKALMGKAFYMHRATLLGLNGVDEHFFYHEYKARKK